MAHASVQVDLGRLKRLAAVVEGDLANSSDGPVRKAMRQWAARYRAFLQERFDKYSKGGGDWPPLKYKRKRGGKSKGKVKSSKPQKTKHSTGSSSAEENPNEELSKTGLFKLKFKVAARLFKEDILDLKKELLGGGKSKGSGKSGKSKGNRTSILRDTGTLFAALQPVFAGSPGAIEEHTPFGVMVGYGGTMKHPSGNATIADIASFHQEGAGNLPVRRIIVPPDDATQTLMAGDMRRALDELTG